MSRLDGRTVALSVSQAPDLARLGYPRREVDRALYSLCGALIRAGARVQYAGDLRPDGFTFKLFRHLAGAYAGRDEKPFVHVVSEPVLRRTPLADLVRGVREGRRTTETFVVIGGRLRPARAEGEALIVRLEAGDRRVAAEADLDTWLGRAASLDRPGAFTLARRAFTAVSDARVTLGGKMGLLADPNDAYEGALPGIVEESLFAFEASQPLVPLGAFGGATRDVALELGLLPPSARVERGPQAHGYAPCLARLRALRSALPAEHLDRLRAVAADDRTEHLAQAVAGLLGDWLAGQAVTPALPA